MDYLGWVWKYFLSLSSNFIGTELLLGSNTGRRSEGLSSLLNQETSELSELTVSAIGYNTDCKAVLWLLVRVVRRHF